MAGWNAEWTGAPADKLRVLIRADASGEIGGGHIARCLTLADALRQLGCSCTFACAEGSELVVPGMLGRGFEVIIMPHAQWNKPDWLLAHCQFEPDLLIVDHHKLDFTYENAWRGRAGKIAVLDDLNDRHHDADLLVDENPARSRALYQPLVPASCRILVGGKYAVVDPECAKLRQNSLDRRKQERFRVRRLFISMGLTDRFSATAMILEAVASLDPDLKIDVSVGPTAPSIQELKALASKLGERVTLHIGVPSIVEIMARADLAIGSPGTTSWLRCVLGVPSILIALHYCQPPFGHELARAGAALFLGDFEALNRESIALPLKSLLNDPAAVKRLSDAAAAVTDGTGAMLVAVNMYNLAKQAHPKTANVKRLLVFCTGNYYRSRFVAALFNHLAGERGLDWEAVSRGIAIWEGFNNEGPIAAQTLKYLSELGVPLPDEYEYRMPLPLGEVDLQAADLILAIDSEKHEPLVREHFPDWLSKTTFWEIPDLDKWTPEEALPRLVKLTEALVEKLLAAEQAVCSSKARVPRFVESQEP
jgi:UDP-2,4-diacetamido-2,4,6-trideoxy-beta-L-altropyranose hydrolase